MFICGKSKDDYITGAATAPKEDDSTFKAWKANNNMVMSWLVNSMTPEIGENFLLYATAAEIWEAAKVTFSSSENTSEVFETESLLYELRQGDLSVTQYFSSLTRHWQKIDLIDTQKWTCPEDGKLYRQIVETKRVFKFLSGLNKELDEARGRVISIKPLPSLREVFSVIRHEESRRKIMMCDSTTPVSDASALAASVETQNQIHATKVSNDRRNHKTRPYCEHCRRPGHTRETCWKIHGKPHNWKSSRSIEQESRGNAASTTLFSKDQLELLQSLINQSHQIQAPLASSSSTTGGANVAQRGLGLGEDDWQC
ncbi:uncharacterized protein [Primulina huaijiensis]|uniref:uncharacterized protein n=1 Tax=Primulina huaijiensis TaxID=1492673 RepID=UPI003CC72060